MNSVVAVILSVWRPGDIVSLCIKKALSDSAIDSVHVWGYEPTGKAHYHPLNQTLYHKARNEYVDDFTHDTLAAHKFAHVDSTERIRWRTKVALDMWFVLRSARMLFPDSIILYLENDAIIRGSSILGTIERFKRSNAAGASCYGKENGGHYDGVGAVCLLLQPRARPEAHLLAYHMVQPADWIVSDYSQKQWPVYDAVSHGLEHKAHTSTRLLQ